MGLESVFERVAGEKVIVSEVSSICQSTNSESMKRLCQGIVKGSVRKGVNPESREAVFFKGGAARIRPAYAPCSQSTNT